MVRELIKNPVKGFTQKSRERIHTKSCIKKNALFFKPDSKTNGLIYSVLIQIRNYLSSTEKKLLSNFVTLSATRKINTFHLT